MRSFTYPAAVHLIMEGRYKKMGEILKKMAKSKAAAKKKKAQAKQSPRL